MYTITANPTSLSTLTPILKCFRENLILPMLGKTRCALKSIFLYPSLGLSSPDESLHGFYMDIQPTMGISLQGRIRMQLNLKVESSKILTDIPIKKGDFRM